MKKFICFLLLICLTVSFSACKGAKIKTTKNDNKKEQKRFLFIGSSYTYVNDLPDMFQELAASGGYNVYVDQSAGPSYTLILHSNPSDLIGAQTLRKIKKMKWDYVILQEQSQHPAYPDLRVSMYEGARELDKLIKKNGSKTAFFMAWGFRDGDFTGYDKNIPTFEKMQEQIRIGYTKISKELSALLVPVGMAWLKAKQQDKNVNLWQVDNVHPTIEGTYLSCCVFYAMLLHENPVGLKYHAGLTSDKARFLQKIAYEICKDKIE